MIGPPAEIEWTEQDTNVSFTKQILKMDWQNSVALLEWKIKVTILGVLEVNILCVVLARQVVFFYFLDQNISSISKKLLK
jgi:hypothetical protein